MRIKLYDVIRISSFHQQDYGSSGVDMDIQEMEVEVDDEIDPYISVKHSDSYINVAWDVEDCGVYYRKIVKCKRVEFPN